MMGPAPRRGGVQGVRVAEQGVRVAEQGVRVAVQGVRVAVQGVRVAEPGIRRPGLEHERPCRALSPAAARLRPAPQAQPPYACS